MSEGRIPGIDADTTATGTVLTTGEAVVRPDALQPGITDVVVPISDASGTVAALTVPYVATTFSETAERDVVAAATATASAISRLLQGEPR